MHRRRSLAIPFSLAALAIVALAPAVLAGGWASVAVVDTPETPVAGETTTLGLEVKQHGVTPVSWPAITVRAAGPGGQVVTAEAVAVAGAEGRYTVDLALPVDGAWTITFLSNDLMMEGTAALDLAPAAVVPPAAAATPTAATPIDDGAARLLFAVVIGGLAVGFALVLLRSRRPVATIEAVGER